MKTCTKCNRVLDDKCFWMRPKTGRLYPSCRQCEKHSNSEFLKRSPLCCRCKLNPHTCGDAYCSDCSRIVKKKNPRKWVSRRTGLEWCKICEVRPKLSYHHYCGPCKKDYQDRTRAKKWALRYVGNAQKKIETARAYATGLLRRGKIKRGPCVFCGNRGVQFHHYDYELKTRNFDSVCRHCHIQIHRFLKLVVDLTSSQPHIPIVIGF